MTPSPYKIYVFHRSYFCGKMLAYLRYKEIPHTAIYESLAKVGSKIMSNTGLRQMPVIETPEGEWLQDTTPMIDWFEQQHQEHPILPDNPAAAFLAQLLEDYADEWLWRPAIYYRWMHDSDRHMYKTLFVKEFIGGLWASNPISRWIGGKLVQQHQHDKFLYGDGMTEENRAHVESIYTNTLARLEALFQTQDYLLGDKPCLADFGFFGSMFWHFSNDPTSNRIMQEQAPAVNEWVARMWNAKASRFADKSFNLGEGEALVPQGWAPLLKDICEHYLPYLEQNALEFERENDTFYWHVEGYTYPSVHVSPYRVWCRERLQSKFNALSQDDQERVQNELSKYGGLDALLSSPHIRSKWDPEGIAPLCKAGKVPLIHKLMSRFTGSNHVRSRRAWETAR